MNYDLVFVSSNRGSYSDDVLLYNIWQHYEFSHSPLIQLMSQDSLPDDPDDYDDPDNSGTTLGPHWDHSETTL